jgi:acyl-CoA synthetase (AMP-forming)/AMP-acid ligase II
MIAPGCRMAIVGNNHAAYVIGYFVSQCLGRPTVEVRPLESIDRQIEIVKQTNATFVLTDVPALEQALKERIPVMSFDRFIRFCEEAQEDKHFQFEDLKAPGSSSLEASIIYTSGTTGTPKGVILTQGNFIFIIEAVAEYLGLTCEDRYALILPLNHTYGKTMMLACVAVGATVVMMDNFSRPQEFVKALSDQKCTFLSAVPYHIHVILKWCNLSKYDLSLLRSMTFSANKLPASTIDRMKAVLPHTEIFSMYGLTESTTRACFVPPHLLMDKKESCGKPLPGVELQIVGEQGYTLPPGEIGEVLIKGPNVMTGYFDDPKLTEETIQDGWLRTGDLGYIDHDGFLFLRGRKKEIIKCAGERISPLEIEEVLIEHPGVADCAVVGSSDPTLGEIVHAFIVPHNGFCEEGELKVHCAQRLSHHKLPRRYTFTSTLPRTGSGKVKKHLLEKGEFDGRS